MSVSCGANTVILNTVSYQQPVESYSRSVRVNVVSCETVGAWKTMVESLPGAKVTLKFVSTCPSAVSTAAPFTEFPAG